MRILWFLVVCLAVLAPRPNEASAAPWGGDANVVVEGPVDHDLHLAGSSVEVRGRIDGDVAVAGGHVSVGDDIVGGVMAAGGTVDVHGAVSRSLRIIGGDVSVAARVGRELMVAGGSVTLSREARIADDAWLAGGHLSIAGALAKSLYAAGANIQITGTIDGDVHLKGRWIHIGPTAVIGGRLSYESEEPADIDAHARIAGGVDQTTLTAPQRARTALHVIGYVARILFALGLLTAGLLLVLIFPGYSLAAARLIGGRPLASLGLGFALLVATPIAVGIAMLTMLGAIVGLVVFAIYCVSLLLALLTSAVFLGDGILRALGRGPKTSVGRRLAALLLGVIAYSVASMVPILGGIVLFAAVVFGLGAFYLEAAERY
jgi:cytoskeletal protein CcmA (bactofilin family)